MLVSWQVCASEKLIGSPDDSSLGFLRSDNARRYVRQLPQYPRQQFSARFPGVSPGALDLLEKMLVFNPIKRMTGKLLSCNFPLGHGGNMKGSDHPLISFCLGWAERNFSWEHGSSLIVIICRSLNMRVVLPLEFLKNAMQKISPVVIINLGVSVQASGIPFTPISPYFMLGTHSIYGGVLQLMRHYAILIWHLFMISMRSRSAQLISVLTSSSHRLPKNTLRSSHGGSPWNSIQTQLIKLRPMIFLTICKTSHSNISRNEAGQAHAIGYSGSCFKMLFWWKLMRL